jgi:hypothetical protein
MENRVLEIQIDANFISGFDKVAGQINVATRLVKEDLDVG